MNDAFRDMSMEEVRQNLCALNPESTLNEVVEDDGGMCPCSNCLHGRSRLAELALRMFRIVMLSAPKH